MGQVDGIALDRLDDPERPGVDLRDLEDVVFWTERIVGINDVLERGLLPVDADITAVDEPLD